METTNPGISPMTREQLRLVRQFEKQSNRHTDRFDHGTAQLFREWLWTRLTTQFNVSEARAIYQLILAMRRIALSEEKSPKHQMSWRERSAAALELFGDFPPMIPYDAPRPSDGPAETAVPAPSPNQ